MGEPGANTSAAGIDSAELGSNGVVGGGPNGVGGGGSNCVVGRSWGIKFDPS